MDPKYYFYAGVFGISLLGIKTILALFGLGGDHDVDGDEWWYSLPQKKNPSYEYLTRIVDTIKEALNAEKG